MSPVSVLHEMIVMVTSQRSPVYPVKEFEDVSENLVITLMSVSGISYNFLQLIFEISV